jgi:hypothetical protein
MDFALSQCAFLHNTFNKVIFVSKNEIPALKRPPYLPDLTLCDFLMSMKLTDFLKDSFI